jgi:hypothetical protein
VPETIEIEVPRRGIGSDLTEALAAQGLRAEIIEDGDAYKLRVSFAADEHERLVVKATHAIETYLADRMLPLVVQRDERRGVVVRPPSD